MVWTVNNNVPMLVSMLYFMRLSSSRLNEVLIQSSNIIAVERNDNAKPTAGSRKSERRNAPLDLFIIRDILLDNPERSNTMNTMIVYIYTVYIYTF